MAMARGEDRKPDKSMSIYPIVGKKFPDTGAPTSISFPPSFFFFSPPPPHGKEEKRRIYGKVLTV